MKDKYPQSTALFERARGVIPGGVNSPVRAFRGVGGAPLFIKQAGGATITDADGREYIDYVGSWGPMILGHAHPKVIAAIQEAATRGTSYGAPTRLEVELAEEVIEAFPSIEMLRLTSSGTEATMSALRVARGFTGRPKIVKFEGCYHGHGDSLLVRAGSGVATLGLPDSPGVLPEVAQNTITVAFNDAEALEKFHGEFRLHRAGHEQAGIATAEDEPRGGITPCQFDGRGHALGRFIERDGVPVCAHIGRDGAAENDDSRRAWARCVPGRKTVFQTVHQRIADGRESEHGQKQERTGHQAPARAGKAREQKRGSEQPNNDNEVGGQCEKAKDFGENKEHGFSCRRVGMPTLRMACDREVCPAVTGMP